MQRPRVFTPRFTSNVALQTNAERHVPFPNSGASHILAPFRKTQRLKRSVCKRNAYPRQDQGCNDTDPVQCKRSLNSVRIRKPVRTELDANDCTRYPLE